MTRSGDIATGRVLGGRVHVMHSSVLGDLITYYYGGSLLQMVVYPRTRRRRHHRRDVLVRGGRDLQVQDIRHHR